MQFMEVMGALMQIAPEEMQASLEHLDWVALEGEGNGYAPLIDFVRPSGHWRRCHAPLAWGNRQKKGSATQVSVDRMVNQISALAGAFNSEAGESELFPGAAVTDDKVIDPGISTALFEKGTVDSDPMLSNPVFEKETVDSEQSPAKGFY